MVVVIYSFAGFFGFLTYGNDVQDSITLNLPNDQYERKLHLKIIIFQFQPRNICESSFTFCSLLRIPNSSISNCCNDLASN